MKPCRSAAEVEVGLPCVLSSEDTSFVLAMWRFSWLIGTLVRERRLWTVVSCASCCIIIIIVRFES